MVTRLAASVVKPRPSEITVDMAAPRRYAFGYVVLACDMLGDGVAGDASRVIACLRDLRAEPSLMVRRAQAGLAALLRFPGCDGPGRAAVGFCFGGMAALALAPVGVPMAGAISIHGGLGTSKRARPGAEQA